MFPKAHKDIILASSSLSRKMMLEAAGVDFRVVPPDVDEGAIIGSFAGENLTPADIAELLARTKAQAVSNIHMGSWVIGGDQVLSFNDRIFTKPEDLDGARDALLELRGQTHFLHSAVAVAVDGETRWASVETAQMTMRNFSPRFVGVYLGTVGEEICRSVGAYEIEGLGVNLFDEIDGDHFTIRGLPLMALLKYFYDEGVLS